MRKLIVAGITMLLYGCGISSKNAVINCADGLRLEHASIELYPSSSASTFFYMDSSGLWHEHGIAGCDIVRHARETK